MRESVAHEIIQSRLLVLQSKRLMLNTAERRLDRYGTLALSKRVDALRIEADRAQHQYRATMLKWGSAKDSEYWLVAYGRLIDMGQALAQKLRDATPQLPPGERYPASADVEALEGIVEDWRRRVRRSMVSAVA